ncbi:MAG TPA: hypothetical protein VNP90_07130 [Actinomycetota bacterium]|nr:hypothetical protein [Actinomycetota bacterium]
MRAAAVAAAIGFLVIAVFQAALAFGAPLGRAAWGGGQTHLPNRLRIASGVAVVFWLLAALVVLARAGFDVSPVPDAVARWGTWFLVVLLPIGALMNVASSSPWERFLWGPLALMLAVLCFVLARS